MLSSYLGQRHRGVKQRDCRKPEEQQSVGLSVHCRGRVGRLVWQRWLPATLDRSPLPSPQGSMTQYRPQTSGSIPSPSPLCVSYHPEAQTPCPALSSPPSPSAFQGLAHLGLIDTRSTQNRPCSPVLLTIPILSITLVPCLLEASLVCLSP